ncbi:phage terminase small subunit [Pectinatus frisingensis]|uniref:phage terminase small subunit n=1 Tax=Pectinatus frisingensis TaxID=865 RepID=UPI0018C47EEA|nr:phage terminase small subunit [Pectinatus frisingensis]
MARARSPERNRAFELWKESGGKMLLKDIAEKLGVSDSQIRKWKNIDKWDEKLKCNVTIGKGNVTSKLNSNVTIHKKKHGPPTGNKNATGHGAPKGNKNAIGNRGGHAPPKNQNAVRHGLYAKYLPQETLEIAENISMISPIDLLWDNICIKYASILRAQKLMYVDNSEDFTKRTVTDGVEITGYSYQEAWDKHASFLRAQAAAMKTLTSMIKEYEELCKSDLSTQEQQLRIDKLKAEVVAMNSGADNEKVTIIDDIG